MKLLAGDWKPDTPITLKKDWRNKPTEIWFTTGMFKIDKISFSDIVAFNIVTEENKASVLGKVGWGAVGALALGPLGLLAGVLGGGNKRDRVMVLEFRDGRKAMIKGNSKDAEMFTTATFSNQHSSMKTIDQESVQKIEPKF